MGRKNFCRAHGQSRNRSHGSDPDGAGYIIAADHRKRGQHCQNIRIYPEPIQQSYGWQLRVLYQSGSGSEDVSAFEVLSKYLLMPAIDLRFRNISVHVLYWHLLVVFALFTLISISMHRIGSQRLNIPRKTLALMSATWYSILAPLSWYVLFKPHSFIHTHVNTMAWQMPFTLLGFALCGLVITELS
jgi:hypothetical protein